MIKSFSSCLCASLSLDINISDLVRHLLISMMTPFISLHILARFSPSIPLSTGSIVLASCIPSIVEFKLGWSIACLLAIAARLLSACLTFLLASLSFCLSSVIISSCFWSFATFSCDLITSCALRASPFLVVLHQLQLQYPWIAEDRLWGEELWQDSPFFLLAYQWFPWASCFLHKVRRSFALASICLISFSWNSVMFNFDFFQVYDYIVLNIHHVPSGEFWFELLQMDLLFFSLLRSSATRSLTFSLIFSMISPLSCPEISPALMSLSEISSQHLYPWEHWVVLLSVWSLHLCHLASWSCSGFDWSNREVLAFGFLGVSIASWCAIFSLAFSSIAAM